MGGMDGGERLGGMDRGERLGACIGWLCSERHG